MFAVVLRKMWANKWMFLSLLVGMTIAVMLVSSIPTYTDGVLTRMLIKDLEEYQKAFNTFPGRYTISIDFSMEEGSGNKAEVLDVYTQSIDDRIRQDFPVPPISKTKELKRRFVTVIPAERRRSQDGDIIMEMTALEGWRDHVSITHGSLPEAGRDELQFMVTEQAYDRNGLVLGERYLLQDMIKEIPFPFEARLTGIFTVKDQEDTFWHKSLWEYEDSMLVPYNDFLDRVLPLPESRLIDVEWSYAMDYRQFRVNHVDGVLKALVEQQRDSRNERARINFPAERIFTQYQEREIQLRLTLWVINSPVLLVLAFFLYLVSSMIVERDRAEIAVLSSRGAGRGQIFLQYVIEGLLLAAAAMLFGPPLGYVLCRFIGSANGFLEFVQRRALPLGFNRTAYWYSLAATASSFALLITAALRGTTASIVEYKRFASRRSKKPVWQRFYLDFLLLALSLYGLYQYGLRRSILVETGMKGSEIAMDPFLFLISTLFVLAAGMVFIRLIPVVINLIFKAGSRFWSPVSYAAFIRVSRSGSRDHFLMIFLILSISLGIFNVDAARTYNKNIEEKVRYGIGADISLKEEWDSNLPDPLEAGIGPAGPDTADIPALSGGSDEPVIYREPPFDRFRKLPGIDSATKVFRRESIQVQTMDRNSLRNVDLMAVIPNEFGKTAWFRSGLLPVHWYNYLNLLADSPAAALVSSNLRDEHGVRPGDSLLISWNKQRSIQLYVYGFIDYWPSYNPFSGSARRGRKELIVANYPYIHAMAASEPYEVWLKVTEGTPSAALYESLEGGGFKIKELDDASQELIKQKNDPMVQGLNGALTLVFIIALGISFIGFLIYWIFTITERALQFGVYRAMGLSLARVIGILVWEQLLISGSAVLGGVLAGMASSKLFIPLLQIAYSVEERVPPFNVVSLFGDHLKIYVFVFVMLVIGLTILGLIIARIRMHRALKLGEE